MADEMTVLHNWRTRDGQFWRPDAVKLLLLHKDAYGGSWLFFGLRYDQKHFVSGVILEKRSDFTALKMRFAMPQHIPQPLPGEIQVEDEEQWSERHKINWDEFAGQHGLFKEEDFVEFHVIPIPSDVTLPLQVVDD